LTAEGVFSRRLTPEKLGRAWIIPANLAAGFEKVILVCPSRQQAAALQSKVDLMFPANPQIIVTTLSKFLTSFEIVEKGKTG
jgi:hypothetical protein